MFSTQIIRTGLDLCDHTIAAIETQLLSMPDISFGKHKRNGKYEDVIRFRVVSNGKKKWSEISRASSEWSKLFPVAQKCVILKESLESLKAERLTCLDGLSSRRSGFHNTASSIASDFASQSTPSGYSYERWLSLKEVEDKTITNGYAHGCHMFRSKSELLIAQLLEELKLEYKYEVIITVDGKRRWPDFAVYCPEIDRFFFIEHLGRMDDRSYRSDNLEKMEAYEKAGIRNGIDIIYMNKVT